MKNLEITANDWEELTYETKGWYFESSGHFIIIETIDQGTIYYPICNIRQMREFDAE